MSSPSAHAVTTAEMTESLHSKISNLLTNHVMIKKLIASELSNCTSKVRLFSTLGTNSRYSYSEKVSRMKLLLKEAQTSLTSAWGPFTINYDDAWVSELNVLEGMVSKQSATDLARASKEAGKLVKILTNEGKAL